VREDDRAEQVRVVEDFVSARRRHRARARDDTALVPTVKEAAGGKSVVIIDSDIKWSDRVSFVATDNEQAGAAAAPPRAPRRQREGVGPPLPGGFVEHHAAREGFLETLAKEYPGAQIVSENQYGGATTESAYKTAESLLVKFRELDGIFCPNESTTFGMLRALQDAERAGKVTFVGFDSSDKLVAALEKGEINGLVVQDPFAYGYKSVEALADHLDGKPVERASTQGDDRHQSEPLEPEDPSAPFARSPAWLK
jgi:ribose transport system substrate-binding protein